MQKFNFEDHTADVSVWIYGRNLEELLNNIILVINKILIDTSVKNNKEIVLDTKFKINKNKYDLNSLKQQVFDFIEEILFVLDTEFFIVNKCQLIETMDKIKDKIKKRDNYDNNKISEYIIKCYGDDVRNYKLITYIKAITYNEYKLIYDSNKKIFKLHLVFDV